MGECNDCTVLVEALKRGRVSEMTAAAEFIPRSVMAPMVMCVWRQYAPFPEVGSLSLSLSRSLCC